MRARHDSACRGRTAAEGDRHADRSGMGRRRDRDGPAGREPRADEVITKNKLLYRGSVDKDNTLRQISDGLKRVVIRDSKIERIIPGDSYRRFEAFAIDQPMEVHGGAMPSRRDERRQATPLGRERPSRVPLPEPSG